MRNITEKEYKLRMKQIQESNLMLQREQELREERNKYRRKIKLPSTSKLMAAYLFMVLNVVLVYAMVTMFIFQDLTYLGVLITDVAAQVLTYFIYTKKAIVENSKDGITYDMAMEKLRSESNIINTDNNIVEGNTMGEDADSEDEAEG